MISAETRLSAVTGPGHVTYRTATTVGADEALGRLSETFEAQKHRLTYTGYFSFSGELQKVIQRVASITVIADRTSKIQVPDLTPTHSWCV